MALRLRRGTNTQRQTITFADGELIWVTDTGKLFIGDGITQGAKSIIAECAGPGLSYDTNTHELKLDTLTLTTDDINQGSTNLYFSNAAAQNATADLFANGTHVGISYVYDNDLVTPSISSTVTISPEIVEDTIAPMFLDGTHQGVVFTYTDNNSGRGVINASVTVDPEDVQDAIGTLINNGTQTGITVVYNDLIDQLNFSVSPEFVEDTVANMLVIGTQTGITVSYTDAGLDRGSLSFTVDPIQIVDDTAPILGGNLDLDSFDIIGNGNIDILGNITAPGTIEAGDYSILEGSIVSNNIIKLKGNHTSVYCPTDGTLAEPGWMSIDAHKGTYDLPLEVSSNDIASSILLRSYFDGAYQINGVILTTIDPDAAFNSTGIPGVPASVSIKVKSANAAGDSTYTFASNGVFSAPQGLQTGVFATIAARDSGMPYATPGTIIFVTDGSGTGTPQFHGCTVGSTGIYGDPGYVAPTWVSLN